MERLGSCVHNPGDLTELRACERYMTEQPSTSDTLSVPVPTNKRRHSLDSSQLDAEVCYYLLFAFTSVFFTGAIGQQRQGEPYTVEQVRQAGHESTLQKWYGLR